MEQCSRCGHSFDPAEIRKGLDCPSCGLRHIQVQTHIETGTQWIGNYFQQIWAILTRPSTFFRNLSPTGGVGYPLAFALITHWLGSALGFVWKSWIGGTVTDHFQLAFRIAGDLIGTDQPGKVHELVHLRDRVVHWFWGVGSVIADPFVTLASILFTSFFVYVGARIFVTPGRNDSPAQITYESALRVICFGMAPAILAALPIFGDLISSILVLIITVIGAREVYRIEIGRALIVALFPKLLFIGIMILGLAVFAVTAFKFIASIF